MTEILALLAEICNIQFLYFPPHFNFSGKSRVIFAATLDLNSHPYFICELVAVSLR